MPTKRQSEESACTHNAGGNDMAAQRDQGSSLPTITETSVASRTIYEDGTYLANCPTWHSQDSQWKATKIANILRKNGVEPSIVAEFGCGVGEILNCLSREYGEGVVFQGYEISPQAFQLCRGKEKHNLHFFLKDPLQETGRSFDVVMVIDVLEHVEDYFDFLRKIRPRATYKVFHIPLDLSVQSVLRSSPIMNSRSSVGHIHYFTKETALAMLRETGYEVVDHFYTCGSIELPNRGWRANLLKLPRKLFFLVHQDFAVRVLGGVSLLVLAK